MKKIIQNQWIVRVAILILFFLPYLVVNHLALGQRNLPFILGEDSIPYMPWTFVIYLSVFMQAIIIVGYLPKEFLRRILIPAILLMFMHIVFFIIFPVRYPRECFPNTNGLISFFQSIDTPGNCFPSLHVSGAIFLTFCFARTHTSKVIIVFMCIWTALIIVSVLTTKQHYMVDILGAVGITSLIIYKFKDEF